MGILEGIKVFWRDRIEFAGHEETKAGIYPINASARLRTPRYSGIFTKHAIGLDLGLVNRQMLSSELQLVFWASTICIVTHCCGKAANSRRRVQVGVESV
ncbi:hypothetical protein R1flu_001797 [Riccia fluitans]|uniref:Uncharacterized protein n=1 Tax=Riccia fluitans TaxID=41844 RepID=A0ABD1Y7A3_9MARC